MAFLLGAATVSAGEGSLHIVTSFLPLYCWAVNVAGEYAQVENLLPMGAEPHDYAFTPGDARKLARADLIVVNGLGLESWLPTFLRGSPTSSNRIVQVSAGLEAKLIAGGNEHGHQFAGQVDVPHSNAHSWLDPELAMHGVSNILISLQRIDPAHASAYASNALAYMSTLRKLDTEIRLSLAGVTNRAIVTYHDAFPYFARRYGLEIAGVVEQVPEVNPTPKYLARLSRLMRERRIRVICIAPGGRTRLAGRIAEDLHVQLVELDTLETGPLSPSAYEKQMMYNAVVLEAYLK